VSGLGQIAAGEQATVDGLPAAISGAQQIAGGLVQALQGGQQVHTGIGQVKKGAVAPLNKQIKGRRAPRCSRSRSSPRAPTSSPRRRAGPDGPTSSPSRERAQAGLEHRAGAGLVRLGHRALVLGAGRA